MEQDSLTIEKEVIILSNDDKFGVLFHNDDSTPMQLVIYILMQVFSKSFDEAMTLTMAIHNGIKIPVAVYSNYDIAEQKMIESTTLSKEFEADLKVTVEKI